MHRSFHLHCKSEIFLYNLVLFATLLLTHPVYSQPVSVQQTDSVIVAPPVSWLKLSETVPGSPTADFEKSLSAEMESFLDSSYQALMKRTTIKMYFVTIDSITVTKAQFNDFGFHLMQYWFAAADTNQYGGIVLVSKGLKKIQVFSSKNLDNFISEAEMKNVIGKGFIPGYAAGDFSKGSREGTKLLNETLLKNYDLRNKSGR
jgi:uncharacterized membrane protein YgcG